MLKRRKNLATAGRRCVFLLIGVAGFSAYLFGAANDIFRTKLSGIATQSFDPGAVYNIVEFIAKDSTDGWTYLFAGTGGGPTGAIFRTKLSSTAVKGFNAAPSYIQGFTAASGGNWVYLIANAASGVSDTIIKTKISRTATQSYSCPGEAVKRFIATNPGDGWVYLGIVCGSVGAEEKPVKYTFELGPITPNPFSDRTTISYSVEKAGRVSLKVYDRTGRMIVTLVDEDKEPGTYSVEWTGVDDSGRKAKAGTYFARLSAGEVSIEKIVIVK